MPLDPFLNQSQDRGGPGMPSLKEGQWLFNRRYQLVRRLGAGGMGVVWLARDHTEETDVALKFLPTVLVQHEAEMKRLKEEVRAGKELRHPGIVATFGMELEDSTAAIVMEYVPGQTLKELLEENERGFFEPKEILEGVRNIAEAIDYLHTQAKRVHRDLKPANIIVDEAGRARLMDFGISRRVQESVTRHSKTSDGHGDSSATLAYASPQQLGGKPAHPADDVYSFGALLYELLTGTPPFFRGDADAVGYQIRNEPPAGIDQRRGELRRDGLIRCTVLPFPPAWQKLIFDCLAKDPEDRPTLDELDDFFHQPVIQAAPTPQVEKPGPEKSGSASAGGRNPLTGLREAAAASSRESAPAPEGGSLLKVWGTLMLLALSFIGYMWLAPDEHKPLPTSPPILPPVFTVEDAKAVVSRYYAAASAPTWQQTRLRLWAPAVSYFDHGSLTP